MRVTIVDKCSRCKREVPKEVEHTDVDKWEMDGKQRAQNLTAVVKCVEEFKGALPELIIFFKGSVQTIDRVCDTNCKKTVERQFEAIFREIDPSKRAPRKPRVVKEEDAQLVEEGKEGEEGNTQHKSDKKKKK